VTGPLTPRRAVDDLIESVEGFDPLLIENLDAEDLAYASARAGDPDDPGRDRALNILVRSDPAAAVQVASRLLDLGGDPGALARVVAAIAAAGPMAIPVAVTAASATDPVVAIAAWAAIQQTAGQAQMSAIELLALEASEAASEQASFAQSVVAYRTGMTGLELPVPPASSLLELDADSETLAIQSGAADAGDFARLLHLSSAELYMLSVSAEATTAIDCGDVHMLLALDAGIIDALPDRVVQAPALVGLIAHFSPLGDRYAVHGLVLTWPDDAGGFNVAIHDPSGVQAYFGTGAVADGQAVASLQSVIQPGAVPIAVSIAASPAGVELMQAVSAVEIAAFAPSLELEGDE
jgi:hypothetical protein